MWAQLITGRLKQGKDSEFAGMNEQIYAQEQPGSGLVHSTAMRDQKDPNTVYMLVVFESEEQARARERDPERQKNLAGMRETMREIFEGPLEFTDLEVVKAFPPGASSE